MIRLTFLTCLGLGGPWIQGRNSLLEDVRSGVREYRQTLAQLGASRGSLPEQRLYLIRVS